MELTQSVARLMRAGDDNSKTYQKLKEAVDGLARCLMTVTPQGGYVLPRNYSFFWWPSTEYELEKHDGTKPERTLWRLTHNQKRRENLFALADDIASGWLDEVSALIESETARLKQAITKLDQLGNR